VPAILAALLASDAAQAGAARSDGAPERAALAVAPQQEARGFALSYDLYRGGLRLLRFDLDVDLDAAGYRTSAELRTSGVVGLLFDWRLTARSEGVLGEAAPLPARNRMASHWRGSGRVVDIVWRDGRPAEVTADPPYGDDAVDVADAGLVGGTVDPVSAIAGAILSASAGAPCRPATAIYDGRRRYDVLLAPIGTRRFAASAYAAFDGAAAGCRLTFRRVAGFADDSRLAEIGAEIWLADVGTGNPVPVRLRIETPWGWGLAHLSQARAADGRRVFGAAGD
jgi:hypothetical protein